MALDLHQSGTFARPGLIGRGFCLIVGLLILIAISPLVTDPRPGMVIPIEHWFVWIGLAATIWVTNEVVNIGLRRDFGEWPRYSLVGQQLSSSIYPLWLATPVWTQSIKIGLLK